MTAYNAETAVANTSGQITPIDCIETSLSHSTAFIGTWCGHLVHVGAAFRLTSDTNTEREKFDKAEERPLCPVPQLHQLAVADSRLTD